MSLGHVRLVLLAILPHTSSHIRNVEHRVAIHIRRSVQTRDVKSRLVLFIKLLASSMFFISVCQRLIDSLYLAGLVLEPIQTIVLHHLTLTHIHLRSFKHPNLLCWNVLIIWADCLMALLCRPILAAAIVFTLILIWIIDVVD